MAQNNIYIQNTNKKSNYSPLCPIRFTSKKTNPREFDRKPDPVYRHHGYSNIRDRHFFHYKTRAETFVNYYE